MSVGRRRNDNDQPTVKSSATLLVNWEGSENFRIAIPLIFIAQ